jgi:four helix bundle protein
MNEEERKRALRQRTKEFAGRVVRFFMQLDRRRDELSILGKQLIRSATSVAAQYREASRARSPKNLLRKSNPACKKPMKANSGWNFCVMNAV